MEVTYRRWSHTGQHLCSISIYSSILALTCTAEKNESSSSSTLLHKAATRDCKRLIGIETIQLHQKRTRDMKLDLSIIQFSSHYKNADCRMPQMTNHHQVILVSKRSALLTLARKTETVNRFNFDIMSSNPDNNFERSSGWRLECLLDCWRRLDGPLRASFTSLISQNEVSPELKVKLTAVVKKSKAKHLTVITSNGWLD